MDQAELKRQKEIESASFKLPNFRKSPRLAYEVAVRRKVVDIKQNKFIEPIPIPRSLRAKLMKGLRKSYEELSEAINN